MNNFDSKSDLKFLQVNLQHSYSAMVTLEKTLDDYKPDVVLLHEPYGNKSGNISCIP